MALNNDPTISEFGRRLFALIDEKDRDAKNEEDKIKTAKGLAKKFFDLGLVHVNSNRKKFNDEQKIRDNAIASIAGTISDHIKTGLITDQKGELVLAYCKFFHVSADYIYGLTDIRTPDVEIRTICEKTLLSEKAVNRLIKRNPLKRSLDLRSQPVPRELWSDCWSLMIESSLFETLPADWRSLCKEIQKYNQEEAEKKAIEQIGEKVTDTIVKLFYDTTCKGVQAEADRHQSAYYGYLAKISRDVSNCLDKAATEIHRTEDIKSRAAEDAMSHAEDIMNDAYKLMEKHGGIDKLRALSELMSEQNND